MTHLWKPELLAPAKNLERLKVAITYGADAVYVGGQKYGLRARADNFTQTELREAANFAHAHGAKLYVTLNAYLHDDDFAGLEDYCAFLESIGIDAVIVSDLGVMRVVRRSCNIDIHLSTQASCLNTASARVWKQLGAKRLIMGRELSIAEGGYVYQQAGIEVEMFTHGAMCMAYSGHCTISNFTAGRDSNRGGCVQSCRFPYHLQAQQPQAAKTQPSNLIAVQDLMKNDAANTQPFMSSKDLWGIGQVADFFEQRICSLKIEGRMKSSLYVATTCKVYRRIIDAYAEGRLTPAMLDEAARELQTVPHRDYAAGSLDDPAGQNTIFGQFDGINTGTHKYLGMVVDTTPEHLVLRLIEPLTVGDTIEILPSQASVIQHQVAQLRSITGETIDQMRQDSVVYLPRNESLAGVDRLNVIRVASLN